MALTKNYEFKSVPIENAYHRISNIKDLCKRSDGKFKYSIDVEVSAGKGTECIESHPSYATEVEYNGGDILKEAYGFLKSRPELEGAKDA